MTAAVRDQRHSRAGIAMAIAFGWWLRPDRSTSGLAALLGGVPLGAFIEAHTLAPTPQASTTAVTAQP